MQWISPFWAGARRLAGRLDLRALADRAGGWAALEGAGVAGLVELGLTVEQARSWLDTPAERTRGVALTLADPRYPPAVAAVADAPPVLCVEGDVSRLVQPSIGIVGTRRCTPYGIAVARHLGTALARRGLGVISGLARGIDGHAHRGALAAGWTAAVLGHGLGHTAPASHRRLRADLLAHGGALITTFPDALPPARWTFPSRNRWIAALSRAVVVVEAPLRSGALITAADAADLDRDVYVVPAALGLPSSAGCLQLLAAGARPIHDVEEVAEDLARQHGTIGPGTGRDAPTGLESHLLGGLTPVQLAERVDEPLEQVLAQLAVLEVQGRVARLPGQIYVSLGAPRV